MPWTLIRDDNYIPASGWVSSADATLVLPLKINPATGRVITQGWGAWSTAFTWLTDVPSSYAWSALRGVRVNAGATALEFVTIDKALVWLGNVDNTSDASKPVSTAQASADTATLNSARTYADGLVVWLLDDRGNYNASGNVFPSSGWSGTAWAILKGDLWTISIAGTLWGVAVTAWDVVRAIVDTPWNTLANWAISENNFGYVAENTTNKDASGGYAGLTLFRLNMRNVANTISSWFTNANTVARTYTLPDKNGTVAMTSDITGTNSGTNTGDQTTIAWIAGTMAQFDTAVSDGNIVYQSQALGTPISGNLNSCTADWTNNVWFRNIPQNSQSVAYTLVLADSGKHIYHPSADVTARTWTIPDNASVAYPIGTAITFINDTSAWVITISITTDTMILASAGTTGSRTLVANGIATATKITSTRWIISGTWLT